jgi:membrane protease YdiL (CAAX protease family)
MEPGQAAATADHPLWRRIIDFPLVALIVAIALFIIAHAAGILIARYLPPMDSTARLAVTSAIDIALVLAIYKLLIIHLGDRPRDDLQLSGAPTQLGVGLAIGFVLFSVVVGAAAVADVYNIVGPGGTQQLLVNLIAAAIVPAFMEELLFRGILFRWIEEFGGSWVALVITSALFGLAHILNPNATWFSSFAIAIEAGVLLGAAYMLTRNLWMPMGLHAAWNFTQGEIFDVPVSGLDQQGLVNARLSGPELLSGGSFGLEASVIALTIATAAGIGLVILAVRRGQLVAPWWVRRKELPADQG